MPDLKSLLSILRFQALQPGRSTDSSTRVLLERAVSQSREKNEKNVHDACAGLWAGVVYRKCTERCASGGRFVRQIRPGVQRQDWQDLTPNTGRGARGNENQNTDTSL